MFKKSIKVSSNSLLSGKDKKKLKQDLSTVYDKASIEHLFDNNEKITCSKVSGSKVLLYLTEEYPVFIDSTSKGDYFPTS